MMKPHLSHAVIVDDDRSSLEAMGFLLRRAGFTRVARFARADEALAYVKRHGADLIVSDFQTAPMNGLAFLRAVRCHPRLWRAPFLMVAASRDETQWKLSIEFGVTEFLFKPLSARDFRDAIATCADAASPPRSAREIVRTGLATGIASAAVCASALKRKAFLRLAAARDDPAPRTR